MPKDEKRVEINPRAAIGYMALDLLASKIADRMANESSSDVRGRLFGAFREAVEIVMSDMPELLAKVSADSVAKEMLG